MRTVSIILCLILSTTFSSCGRQYRVKRLTDGVTIVIYPCGRRYVVGDTISISSEYGGIRGIVLSESK